MQNWTHDELFTVVPVLYQKLPCNPAGLDFRIELSFHDMIVIKIMFLSYCLYGWFKINTSK